MPIRYREVLEYMQGFLASYPLSFQADETAQQYIVADRNGYQLGESLDLKRIEDTVKGENEAFMNTMQRKTFGQLIAMLPACPVQMRTGNQGPVCQIKPVCKIGN